jgi:phosphoribosylformylglycinamidine synthase
MIREELILSLHDRNGDGGLITCLAEMAISGNSGMSIQLGDDYDAIARLFAEEAGWVVEYLPSAENRINEILGNYDISYRFLGLTTKESNFSIQLFGQSQINLLYVSLYQLRVWWEMTSNRLECEKGQTSPILALNVPESYLQPPVNYHVSFLPEPTPADAMSKNLKPKVAIIRDEGSNGDREMASAFYLAGFDVYDVMVNDLLTQDERYLDQFCGLAFVGGFSRADALGSAKGWAGTILFNMKLRKMFRRFYYRSDTFSLGVCNGCQLMALLGWIPWKGIAPAKQPRFITNASGKFESRWSNVKVLDSPSIMLGPMAGSTLGIWVAHGEGRLYCPDEKTLNETIGRNLVPLVYVDGYGDQTVQYPFNPNGSPYGITALCSPDGRHLAMMPHPERAFLLWQWPYLPEAMRESLIASPWLSMFQNARIWCEQNK